MNYLVLDAGNTEVKLGLFVDRILDGVVRIPTHPPDDFSELLQSTVQHYPSLSGVGYCSVVPQIGEAIHNFFTRQGVRVLQAQPVDSMASVHLGGYPPEQLGADRWTNLVALRHLYPARAAIVLSFGTATTVDALSPDGVFLGGVITPGMKTFSEILARKTAQLPSVTVTPVQSVFGRNTQECLQAGVGVGYIGVIREILTRMRAEQPSMDFITVTTGGMTETFQALCQNNATCEPLTLDYHEPTLTLTGLRLLIEGESSGNR